MMHVFLIFNNLNKRVCEAYASYKGVDPSNAVFLNFRPGTYKSGTYREVDFYKKRTEFVSFKSEFHFFASALYARLKGIRTLDKMIDDVAEKKAFSLYLPHVYSPVLSAISSHCRCQKVFIVEEGDASYFPDRFYDPFGFKSFLGNNAVKRISRWLGLTKRIGDADFFPKEQAISGSICISGQAFPFYKDKEILRPSDVFSTDNVLSINYNGGCSLFLIDPGAKFGWLSEVDYLSALSYFISDFKKIIAGVPVVVSFHPSLRDDIGFINKVSDVFSQNRLDYQVYSGDIEALANSVEGCQIFGIFSSSLRYGKLLGCKAYNWVYFIDGLMVSEKYDFLKRYHLDIGTVFLQPGGKV